MRGNNNPRTRLVFGAILTGNAGLLAACTGTGSLPTQGGPLTTESIARDAAMAAPLTSPTWGPVQASPRPIPVGTNGYTTVHVWQVHGNTTYSGPFSINIDTCKTLAGATKVNNGYFTVNGGSTPGDCELIVNGSGGKSTTIEVEVQAEPTPTWGPVKIVLGPDLTENTSETGYAQQYRQSPGSPPQYYTGPFTLSVDTCKGLITASPIVVAGNAAYFTITAGSVAKMCTVAVTGAAGKVGHAGLDILP